jgi:hypothetical protein
MTYQSNPDTVDTAASGSLGALNATVPLLTSGVGTSIFEIAGSWVGTITFEGSNNGFTTSQAVAAVYLGGIQNQSSTTTTNGFFSVLTAGFAQVRARMSAYTSGTATVLANGSAADRIVVPVQGNPNNNQTLASQADTPFTATISATDVLGGTPGGAGVLINTAPTANSFAAFALPGGSSNLDIMITGTATGAYWFEYSMDSTTGSDGSWTTGNYRQTGVLNTVLVLSASAAGIYRGNGAGFKYVRVRNIGGTTPSNTITIRATNGGGTCFLNASIPAGSNTIGNVNQTLATAEFAKVTDGASTAAVKAASTAAIATDPSLVVAISPNNTVAVTQATAANLNATVSLAAAQTLSTVTTVGAVTAITNALPAGANTIGSVKIANSSTGGATTFTLISAASTNATSVKGSSGTLLSINAYNNGGTVAFLKIYNKASAPTVGTDTAVKTILLPPGGGSNIVAPVMGYNFSNGIAYAVTGLPATADTTAVALNQVIVNGSYV